VGQVTNSPEMLFPGLSVCLGDRNDYGLKKLVSMVLLPLPTELADGLRLEGVSLKYEIRPKVWFLRSSSGS